MGALLVVRGDVPEPERESRLTAMAQQAPHRGTLHSLHGPGVSIGVQTRGQEASLFEDDDLIVGVNGRAYDPDARLPYGSQPAAAEVAAGVWSGPMSPGLDRLDGEYALSIYDKRRRALYACVSLLTTKPLYRVQRGALLILASEIRQCAAGAKLGLALDPEQVALSFWLGGPVLDPRRTEYRDIDRLLAPKLYESRSESATTIEPIRDYWTPPPEAKVPVDDPAPPALLLDALSQSISALNEPTALSLSAGHDSGLLWTIAREAPPRSGPPRNYSLAWPGHQDDEREYLDPLLLAAGDCTEYVDVADAGAFDFLTEHVDGLDRIPTSHTTHNATLLARRISEQGNRSHIFGIGGEAALMISTAYMGDLLRRGRFIALAQDIWRFRPYLRSAGAPWKQQIRLARGAIAPKGSRLWRWRHRNRLAGIGRHWAELCASGLETLDDLRKRDGYGRGERLTQIAYHGLLSGTETLDQLFEQHGLENVAPYTYRRVMDLGFAFPPRTLSRGRFEKQTLRECAELALGAPAPWPTRKLTPAPVWTQDERLLRHLGPPATWHMVALGIIDPDAAGDNQRRASRSERLPDNWSGAAYFELYLRRFGT